MAKNIETLNYMLPQVAYRSTFVSRPGGGFIDALNTSIKEGKPLTNEGLKDSSGQIKVTPQDAVGGEKLLIGQTSHEHPTVSELLLGSKEFGDKGWEIIYSKTNSEKPYTKIPLGTPIYIDSKTGELSWPKSEKQKIASNSPVPEPVDQQPEALLQPTPSVQSPQLESVASAMQSDKQQIENAPPLVLGRINDQTPTVSHLLKDSDELAKETWNILAEKINKDKDFTKISKGTEITFNPATREISWQPRDTSPGIEAVARTTAPPPSNALEQLQAISTFSPKSLSQSPFDLTDAVQPYMGKPYSEINCYNLLVKGLKQMGLPYTGKDGLRDRLTSMARERGLPSNAYLNGEGIVKATGRQVLTQSFNQVDNPAEQAGRTFKEMKQLLQKGQILSFSTPTRGHTGIISQNNDQWTFINSGRMDNHVAEATLPKEVGEEDLLNEVENWFKTARDNRESLVVTLGQLVEEKIRDNFNPDFRITKRL